MDSTGCDGVKIEGEKAWILCCLGCCRVSRVLEVPLEGANSRSNRYLAIVADYTTPCACYEKKDIDDDGLSSRSTSWLLDHKGK